MNHRRVLPQTVIGIFYWLGVWVVWAGSVGRGLVVWVVWAGCVVRMGWVCGSYGLSVWVSDGSFQLVRSSVRLSC